MKRIHYHKIEKAIVRYTAEKIHYDMYTQCTNLDYLNLKQMRRKDKSLFLKQIHSYVCWLFLIIYFLIYIHIYFFV